MVTLYFWIISYRCGETHNTNSWYIGYVSRTQLKFYMVQEEDLKC